MEDDPMTARKTRARSADKPAPAWDETGLGMTDADLARALRVMVAKVEEGDTQLFDDLQADGPWLVVTLLGIEGRSMLDRRGAIEAWANAARRRLMEIAPEAPGA
jgi:hypothetical protein